MIKLCVLHVLSRSNSDSDPRIFPEHEYFRETGHNQSLANISETIISSRKEKQNVAHKNLNKKGRMNHF